MDYQFPIPFIGLLLFASLRKHKGDLLSPSNLLCGFYLFVCLASIFQDENDFLEVEFENGVWFTLLGFTVLLIVALLPCLFIRRPDVSAFYAYDEWAKPVLLFLSLLGIYGFVFLFPYTVESLSVNAFLFRELRQVSILPDSPLVTAAAVPATFFAVYGLLFFSPLATRSGPLIKIGLMAGFLCYALNILCNKGRDWVVQYFFLMIFYYWMFSKTWERKRKLRLFIFGGCMGIVAMAYIAVTTMQRFGEGGWGSGAASGTVDYLGQQVYYFVETVAEEDFNDEVATMLFPLYYIIVKGETPNIEEYLKSRTHRRQFAFGTFLGNFYSVGGWKWLIIFVVTFGLIFSWSFAWLSRRGMVLSYVILLLLYYQFMFQGAFYWVMYGRSWNVYIVTMLGAALCFSLGKANPGRAVGRKMQLVRP